MENNYTFSNIVDDVFNVFDTGTSVNYMRCGPTTYYPDHVPGGRLKDYDTKYTITFDIPGVVKKDIDIKLKCGVVTIEAVRKDHGESYRFNREFFLPKGVDSGTLSATCDNGVLELTVDKRKEAMPVNIKVD